jgi:hypothetical protein
MVWHVGISTERQKACHQWSLFRGTHASLLISQGLTLGPLLVQWRLTKALAPDPLRSTPEPAFAPASKATSQSLQTIPGFWAPTSGPDPPHKRQNAVIGQRPQHPSLKEHILSRTINPSLVSRCKDT